MRLAELSWQHVRKLAFGVFVGLYAATGVFHLFRTTHLGYLLFGLGGAILLGVVLTATFHILQEKTV